MQGATNLIIDATRKASRSLKRDFFEIENLQSAERKNNNFYQRACKKASETLHENLNRYYKNIIFSDSEAEKARFEDRFLLVETLDGLSNFERALPYFATMVSVVRYQPNEKESHDVTLSADISVINFHAIGEIYYAEKGKGAWVEKLNSNMTGASRVRVSGLHDMQEALIAGDPELIFNLDRPSESKIKPSNVRLFSSYTYSLAQLVSGKIDAMVMRPRKIALPGVQLFTEEAGGLHNLNKDRLMASNFNIHEKIFI